MNPRRSMCAAILSLQAIVLGLSIPVMISISEVDAAVALWVGLGLVLACIVVAGMLRRPWASWAGWLIQAATIALGIVVPMMFVLGAIFALLWGTADWLGRKIDRERAAFMAGNEILHQG